MVERAVLKWSHAIKPPGKLTAYNMTNISTSGDFAVVLNYRKGENEYGELTLFNSDGKIMWAKYYEHYIFNPQLSDDGKAIAVQSVDVLMAYSNWGREIFIYDSRREEGVRFSAIKDYKLSRDGRYVVLTTESKTLGFLSSWRYKLILLKDGNIVWVKSSSREFYRVSISSNNAYVAVASLLGGPEKRYSRATLYTVDGKELWSTKKVEGFTSNISVSSRGEILLSTDKCILIRDGRVLWTKDDCTNASFTRDEDKIIAIRKRGYDLNNSDVVVFNRDGEPLWEHRGAYRFAVAGNYYVLGGDKEVVLVSADGVVLQRIKLRELIEKEVSPGNVYVSISPEGKYFVASAEGGSEGPYYLYFFENRDHLIRGIKEKLLKEIDELIKR